MLSFICICFVSQNATGSAPSGAIDTVTVTDSTVIDTDTDKVVGKHKYAFIMI